MSRLAARRDQLSKMSGRQKLNVTTVGKTEVCNIGVIFRQKNIDSANKIYQNIDDRILDFLKILTLP